MAIFKAKVVDDELNIKKIINVEDIKGRDDYRKNYANKLRCPEENCNAELVYVEGNGLRVKQYFRTYKNSKHYDNCKYRFETSASLQSSRYGETLLRSLSKEAKRRILSDVNRKLTRSSDESSQTSKRKKSKVVNRNADKKSQIKISAVTDPNIEPLEKGQRSLPVRRRNCTEITSKDIGLTRTVYGEIEKVIISDELIKIYLVMPETKIIFAEFYNSFRSNSPEAFNDLKRLKNQERLFRLKKCVCIGLVEQRKEGLAIVIEDSECISIDGKSIFAFVSIMINSAKN